MKLASLLFFHTKKFLIMLMSSKWVHQTVRFKYHLNVHIAAAMYEIEEH